MESSNETEKPKYKRIKTIKKCPKLDNILNHRRKS